VKLGVTGGRSYMNKEHIREVLERIKFDTLIVGDATGADALAHAWAVENNKNIVRFSAEWGVYGKRAGPMRNAQIVEACDVLLAFPGGRGTANCVAQACQKGKTVMKA